MSSQTNFIDQGIASLTCEHPTESLSRPISLAVLSNASELQAHTELWKSIRLQALSHFNDSDTLIAALEQQHFDFIIFDQEYAKQRFLDKLKKIQAHLRFIFISKDDHAPLLLKLASAGHYFSYISLQHSRFKLAADLLNILLPRHEQRKLIQGLNINFDTANQHWQQALINISQHGLAWKIDKAAACDAFTPGSQISNIVISLGPDTLFTAQRAYVRHISTYSSHASHYQVGVEFHLAPIRERYDEKIFKDNVTVTALLKQALEHAEFQFNHAYEDSTIILGSWKNDNLTHSQPIIFCGDWPEDWRSGTVIRGVFEINNWGCEFLAAIEERLDSHTIKIQAPSRLRSVKRRVQPRQRLSEKTEFIVKFRLPFSSTFINSTPRDLSTQGFSVDINLTEEPIIPGSHINAILILGADNYFANCTGVISYVSRINKHGSLYYRCGIKINDLTNHQSFATADAIVGDKFANVKSGQGMTLDELWRFFYASNFIYPKKEEAMRPILDSVQKNFAQLIQDRNSPILRTIVVNSQIDTLDAHMSLLLAYEHTWIMQHLASIGIQNNNKAAAKDVYLGTMSTLSQLKNIHWMRAYFQPQKSSPDKLAGVFARRVINQSLSNINIYAYLSSPTTNAPHSDKVLIRTSTSDDFKIIQNYHVNNESLCEFTAEDGSQSEMHLPTIQEKYAAYGLSRSRQFFIAEVNGSVTGFASMETSSFGLNLSEVTNRCMIHAWDHELTTVTSLALHARALYYKMGYIFCIIMTKPDHAKYLTPLGFNYSRDYACWTLHRSLFPDYADYIEKVFRNS